MILLIIITIIIYIIKKFKKKNIYIKAYIYYEEKVYKFYYSNNINRSQKVDIKNKL